MEDIQSTKMKAALRGSYIEFVRFNGVTERYPDWFEEELYRNIYVDESRFTFWAPEEERKPDYYEKQLIEDYSVFLRKPNGDMHVTDEDVFTDLYTAFTFNAFTNSGIAAFEEDCIDYVECHPGELSDGYPNWFYEYFTEAINFPNDEETIYLYDAEKHCLRASRGTLLATAGGGVTVDSHCVFLRNKRNEVRGMMYHDFIKYYDPQPNIDYMGGLNE